MSGARVLSSFAAIHAELDELSKHLSDIIRGLLDTVSDPELLSLAIKVSGLSVREFARRLPDAPNSRTVFRWLAGHHPLSQTVREICTRMVLEATPLEPE